MSLIEIYNVKKIYHRHLFATVCVEVLGYFLHWWGTRGIVMYWSVWEGVGLCDWSVWYLPRSDRKRSWRKFQDLHSHSGWDRGFALDPAGNCYALCMRMRGNLAETATGKIIPISEGIKPVCRKDGWWARDRTTMKSTENDSFHGGGVGRWENSPCLIKSLGPARESRSVSHDWDHKFDYQKY